MALASSSRRRPQQHSRRLFLSSQGRHHVSEAHLKRYLAEFDFRYNNRVPAKAVEWLTISSPRSSGLYAWCSLVSQADFGTTVISAMRPPAEDF